MTRKDYEKIAGAVKAGKANARVRLGTNRDDVTLDETTDEIALVLADVLQAENPLFDRARFLVACGALA